MHMPTYLVRSRHSIFYLSYPLLTTPDGRCKLRGAKSPGPPKGNRNAWKHGRDSAVHIARRRHIRALLQLMREEAHGATPWTCA